MKVSPTEIAEVLLVEPVVHGDARGSFLETWAEERYLPHGIGPRFVQDNVSRSVRGTIRGLHLQYPDEQGKLVSVAWGEVLDVAVDVRIGSPTFGKYTAHVLSDENHRQLWIPEGFAHGFAVRSEVAIFTYKCTGPYRAASEIGVAWDDPALAIPWDVAEPIVSAKDRAQPRLADIDPKRLPKWRA
jgi:dTDP-4-dehydrorhamnose 3,5-epimerase